jgi:hypothetical protein
LQLVCSRLYILSPKSELNDIEVGDWLAFVSTSKASDPVLQQVTVVTNGLVKTKNYTFRKDGRAFLTRYRSLTARPATEAEIEKWLSRQKTQQTKSQPNDEHDYRPDVVLARCLASVSADEWLQLGLAQLKKIKAALEKSETK